MILRAYSLPNGIFLGDFDTNDDDVEAICFFRWKIEIYFIS